MANKLRVGIVGCGGIANGKHLPSLSKVEAAEIVAFCDIIEDKAIQAASEYGVKGSYITTDYQKLVAQDIDVVHVCTPNDSHAVITVAALEAGKHVMSEKPMAKRAEDAKKMLEASKRTGKKLTIGYQSRHREDSQYLYRACREGKLGDIYFAKAHAIRRRAVPTWGVFLDEEKQGGGPLIDIGTHALDLTLWLMDNYEPHMVVGKAYHKLSQRENAANAWGSWDPKKFTVEDSAFGFIVMKNGASLLLESSWALNTLQVDEAKSTLCGTEGGADMIGGLRLNGEEYSKLWETKVDLGAGGAAFYEGQSETPEGREARLWIDAIINDTDPVVLPEQALVVSQILEAIYESNRTGLPVMFE
ncbi:MAG: Gfo/Idh/MocA family oxidoreductase [Armatimonadetes bacterium]|nr:Gfo/Idh/MocA family oxidoreductase [Armatimonadota bacterium]